MEDEIYQLYQYISLNSWDLGQQSELSTQVYSCLLGSGNSKRFLRIRRRKGNRWLYFVPGLIMKVATTDGERLALRHEHARTRLAQRAEFWRTEVVANLLLPPPRSWSPAAGATSRRMIAAV